MNCVFMLSVLATVLQQAFTGPCPCHIWKPNYENMTYDCLNKTWSVFILPFNPRISVMHVEYNNEQKTIEEIPDGTKKLIDSIHTQQLILWTVCRAYDSDCVSEKSNLTYKVQDVKCNETNKTADVTDHPGNTVGDNSVDTIIRIAVIVTWAVIMPVVLIISVIIMIYKCSKKRIPSSVNSSQGSSADSSPNSPQPNTQMPSFPLEANRPSYRLSLVNSCLTINDLEMFVDSWPNEEVSKPLLQENHPTLTETTYTQHVGAPSPANSSADKSPRESACGDLTDTSSGTPQKSSLCIHCNIPQMSFVQGDTTPTLPIPSHSPLHKDNQRRTGTVKVEEMTLIQMIDSGNVVSAAIVSTIPQKTLPGPRIELPKHLYSLEVET